MMKKQKIVFALIVCFFVAGPAFAGMSLTVTDSYGDTNGGEFLLKPTNVWPFTPHSLGEVSGEFETFCVEKNEYINDSDTFYAVLNTGAVKGGKGGQTSTDFDPLDPMTAYLYDQFISGTLASYTYDTSGGQAARVASADALQHVMWYIEDEENMAWTIDDNSLMDKFYKDASTNAGGTIGNVRVLNLYKYENLTCHKQDQLVKIPAPGGILLASLGIGLVGWLRRRRTL